MRPDSTEVSISAYSGRSAAARPPLLVGERRRVVSSAAVPLALTVQRLMLAELLEQDYRRRPNQDRKRRYDTNLKSAGWADNAAMFAEPNVNLSPRVSLIVVIPPLDVA